MKLLVDAMPVVPTAFAVKLGYVSARRINGSSDISSDNIYIDQ